MGIVLSFLVIFEYCLWKNDLWIVFLWLSVLVVYEVVILFELWLIMNLGLMLRFVRRFMIVICMIVVRGCVSLFLLMCDLLVDLFSFLSRFYLYFNFFRIFDEVWIDLWKVWEEFIRLCFIEVYCVFCLVKIKVIFVVGVDFVFVIFSFRMVWSLLRFGVMKVLCYLSSDCW